MNRFTGINSIEGCILYDCRQSRARLAARAGAAPLGGAGGSGESGGAVSGLELANTERPGLGWRGKPPPRHCSPQVSPGPSPACCLINGLTGEISGGERLSPGSTASTHPLSSRSRPPPGCWGDGSQGGASSRVLASHDGGQESWYTLLVWGQIRSWPLLSIHRVMNGAVVVHPSCNWIEKKCP